MIIEGNRDFLASITLEFEDAGFEVFTVGDYVRGIAEFGPEKPDLVIMNGVFRGAIYGGPTLFNTIRGHPYGTDVPIIVRSNLEALGLKFHPEDELNTPIAASVPTDITTNDLLELVQALLAKSKKKEVKKAGIDTGV